MERLTYREKAEELSKEDLRYDGDSQRYVKLAEFEDFLESFGCEELEEIEHLIGYPRFIDGYNEKGNKINRIEFITYKESFNEVLEKNKNLKQENQVLKDRWQKLKEWCRENCYFVEECCGDVESDYYEEYVNEYINISQLLEKMQELEKEIK